MNLRKKSGMKLRELAKACDVSFAWIDQVERGDIEDPSYVKLKRIYDYFEAQNTNELQSAEQICSRDIISAKIGDDIVKINETMIKNAISQVPVFANNVCIGMITDDTITNLIMAHVKNAKVNKNVLEPPPPIIAHNVPAWTLGNILKSFYCVLVEKNGKTIGIIVQHDYNLLFGQNTKLSN